ncbi:MAG: hypothetical protein PVF58_22205 [Candidatus Methanofastidiosia archaeon]|jgi:prefoldin subunit 5
MGDPIIEVEIKTYVDKEIGEEFRELNKNIQNLTEIIDKQQQTIETLQKKIICQKEIINTCLCKNCKSKLTCELKIW